MASDISEKLKADLERVALSAEPYPDDAPEMHVLDGEVDHARMMATLAKGVLEGKIK